MGFGMDLLIALGGGIPPCIQTPNRYPLNESNSAVAMTTERRRSGCTPTQIGGVARQRERDACITSGLG